MLHILVFFLYLVCFNPSRRECICIIGKIMFPLDVAQFIKICTFLIEVYATFSRAWPWRNMQRAWNFWSWLMIFWYKYVMLDKTYMYGCTNFIYDFFLITHFIWWGIILKLVKWLLTSLQLHLWMQELG
jgi:hypothetical protein